MRHTIIVTSMLLGMSGAIALASPNGTPTDHVVTAQVRH
jgi:hypothetical protein